MSANNSVCRSYNTKAREFTAELALQAKDRNGRAETGPTLQTLNLLAYGVRNTA